MKTNASLFLYDRWILSIALVLVLFGLLMVSSASMVISDRLYHEPFHYMLRQFIFLITGVGLTWGITRIPLSFWEEISFVLLLLCFFVLLVVLVPHIGSVVNGSRRWIHLGFISLQVSEAVKLMSILYLAGFLQRHLHEVQTKMSGFVKPVIFFGLMGVLLLCEPDFGTTAVIAMTMLSMMFIAGARLLPFIIMFVLIAVAMVGLIITTPYRMLRLTSFLNPWTHAYGSGYQLTQSLIAFGRGGIIFECYFLSQHQIFPHVQMQLKIVLIGNQIHMHVSKDLKNWLNVTCDTEL